MKKALIVVNGLILSALVMCFVFWPAGYSMAVIHSGALSDARIPDFTYDWHANVSEQLAPWARERVASGSAKNVAQFDVAGTEWPIFSTVFYLWATEALQASAVEAGMSADQQPVTYAREAIRAAVDLVADPGHANWVRQHWGDDYLEKENLFYRMLLISGLTSYQKLTGDTRYATLLFDQATSLATELDSSPFGLLDDYPGECYPIDIVAAIAAISRADGALGSDHAAIVNRALRGFEGERLDSATGLPAYNADAKTGKGLGSARGVGVSFMTIWAAQMWPDTAQDWYEKFELFFWQEGTWVSGFREYPFGIEHADLHMDVDAGPVVYGIGTTASAFGIGAARAMGRLDHAYTLSTQAFATMLPMIDGRFFGPRLLSSFTDAPFTGEAIMLFNFTRQPLPGVEIVADKGRVPWGVYAVFAAISLASVLLLTSIVRRVRHQLRPRYLPVRYALPQVVLWAALVLSGLVLIVNYHALYGTLALLLAQYVPVCRKEA